MKRSTLPVLLLVLTTAAACGGSTTKTSSPAPSQAAASAAPNSATVAPPSAAGTTITGDDSFRFNPMAATAAAGPVTITFVGKGSYPHNIHFTSLGKTSTSTTGGITGNTVRLELGTLKPGTYAFVCDYHDGAGMKGALTVR